MTSTTMNMLELQTLTDASVCFVSSVYERNNLEWSSQCAVSLPTSNTSCRNDQNEEPLNDDKEDAPLTDTDITNVEVNN